ncbi:MAG TPA: DegT/DnrJ/EryC1/StrS family aminotransferase [Terriglobales bacterium]|jgi:dTDP-4-amino-4,6-dideoxygalactose transaminase|nr:DegT/DnrJ/EryC1/StrS family aminotransferase [Terriglobales bacterium]
MAESTRRTFLGSTLAGAAGIALLPNKLSFASSSSTKLAVLGGTPVRKAPFPGWPIVGKPERTAMDDVLEQREWCRLSTSGPEYVKHFEQKYAEMTGAKRCLATSSGTTALVTSLNALDVGPGDEVIVPPYTFVATINAVFLQHALPVYVDTDRKTFQIDAEKIEAAITPRTRCILPVHLGGNPVNVDKILAVAKKHNLSVLEDACQAHLAEWRGKKVGTLGDLGCFSFQASKNLNSGEGGAILGNDSSLMQICESFHNNGHLMSSDFRMDAINGSNHRMTEFQGAILGAQMTRLKAQTDTRTENANYLTAQLKEIPGIYPAEMYDGTTRNAYHLYMFRYDRSHFADLPREKFLKALQAEGVPCSAGYTPLNKEAFMENTLNSRAFKRIYSEKELAENKERNNCPENDKLCNEEAVWLEQTMLLAGRTDMSQIAEAVKKIQAQAGELARA